VSTHSERLRCAPKVPVAWVVQLYRRDALLLQDEELVAKFGGRLYARCMDILMVSDGRVASPGARPSSRPLDRRADGPRSAVSALHLEYYRRHVSRKF
jgi:hypothetical protein